MIAVGFLVCVAAGWFAQPRLSAARVWWRRTRIEVTVDAVGIGIRQRPASIDRAAAVEAGKLARKLCDDYDRNLAAWLAEKRRYAQINEWGTR